MIEAHTKEWHEQRKKGIGGSESAAVLGENSERTPYEVWLDKTSDAIKTDEENEVMLWGRLMEPLIINQYSAKTGRKVYNPGWACMEKYPFVCGNVDGLTDDRVVESKAPIRFYEEPPKEYILQCQHYMMLHNRFLADIVWLNPYHKLCITTIEADPELQEIMLKIYVKFWHGVETRTPPDCITLADVAKKYPFDNGDTVELSTEAQDKLKEILTLKSKIATLEAAIAADELFVKKEMGENQIGLNATGGIAVTWKTSKPRMMVDTARLKEDGLYDQYLKQGSTSRTFIIKEKING